MNTPPPQFDERDLLGALQAGWGFNAVSVQYAAVGFGSHHWVAMDSARTKRFVTLDELAKLRMGENNDAVFARLRAAFETARALKDSGLEFVVAPLADANGRVLRRLANGFSLAVSPFVDGQTLPYGDWPSDDERRAVLALIARLHQATEAVADIAKKEDFLLPCRAELDVALAELAWPWTGGPFSDPARQLLVRIESDLIPALELFDRLVEDVQSNGSRWVITHGEPHAANIIWTPDGPQLIDWDTALLAPAGRDLWMLESPSDGTDRGRDPAIVLYRLWWDLAEIAGYVAGFRLPHDDTADTRESWRNLEHYAQLREHWGDRLQG